MVEIVKVLVCNVKIIVFDELISFFFVCEIDNFFCVICELWKEGWVILYVFYCMEEIFVFSDVIIVFKDGCYVKIFIDM